MLKLSRSVSDRSRSTLNTRSLPGNEPANEPLQEPAVEMRRTEQALAPRAHPAVHGIEEGATFVASGELG